LAQLGTTAPHRIDGFPRRQRAAGFAEWFAGVGFVVAMAAAIIAPVLQLVRTGVFGWMRNPIFTAMITFGFGNALVTPNLVAVAGFLLGLATIELQVGVVEPYLLTVHGDAYRDYLASVGRFVPGAGHAR
jgi:protein-S-isoprenylcysteine O-methyltransferase Ste14